jgi:hypothetical protein
MQLAEGKAELGAIPNPISPDDMPKHEKRPTKRTPRKAVAAD